MALKDVTEKMRDEQQAALGETAFFAAQTAEKVDTTNELLTTQIKIFDKQFKGLQRDKDSEEGDIAEGKKKKNDKDKKSDGKFSKLFGFFKNQKKDKKKGDGEFKLFSMKTLKFFGLMLLGIAGLGLALLALSKSIVPMRELLDKVKYVLKGNQETQDRTEEINRRTMGDNEKEMHDAFGRIPILRDIMRAVGIAKDKAEKVKERSEQFKEIDGEELSFYQKSRFNILKFREQFGLGALEARMNDEGNKFIANASGILGRMFNNQFLQDKQTEMQEAILKNGTFREKHNARFNTLFAEQMARFKVQDRAMEEMGAFHGTMFGFNEGITAPVMNVLEDTVATLGTILPGGFGEMSRKKLEDKQAGKLGIGDLFIERALARAGIDGKTETLRKELERLGIEPDEKMKLQINDRLNQIEINRVKHSIRLRNLEEQRAKGTMFQGSQLLGGSPVIVNAPTDNSQINNVSGGSGGVSGIISDAFNREDRFGIPAGYGSGLVPGMG
jgi:hypothetical protein